MLQSRRTSCFVVDSSKTQAHHESPQRHVGAFVVWNLPIGLQRSRSQLEFEVNLRPKFRGNPGFREIPVWRCLGPFFAAFGFLAGTCPTTFACRIFKLMARSSLQFTRLTGPLAGINVIRLGSEESRSRYCTVKAHSPRFTPTTLLPSLICLP